MSILPTFNTKDRTTVPTPEAIKLFKGLAFLALGIIGLSFFVTELPVIARLIFMTLGVIFAVFGIRLICIFRETCATVPMERSAVPL